MRNIFATQALQASVAGSTFALPTQGTPLPFGNVLSLGYIQGIPVRDSTCSVLWFECITSGKHPRWGFIAYALWCIANREGLPSLSAAICTLLRCDDERIHSVGRSIDAVQRAEIASLSLHFLHRSYLSSYFEDDYDSASGSHRNSLPGNDYIAPAD